MGGYHGVFVGLESTTRRLLLHSFNLHDAMHWWPETGNLVALLTGVFGRVAWNRDFYFGPS